MYTVYRYDQDTALCFITPSTVFRGRLVITQRMKDCIVFMTSVVHAGVPSLDTILRQFNQTHNPSLRLSNTYFNSIPSHTGFSSELFP